MSNSGYEIKTDSNGTKYWYLNGKLHREDGPAIEVYDGDKRWYLDDKHYSEEDWKAKIELEGLWKKLGI